VVPTSITGEIAVSGCEYTLDPDRLDYPSASYCAGVCGAAGHSPCLPKTQATVATTWGSIKSLFE
jgi:hypothetical protein